ncbi:gamma-aminobutyric acid type B receptor subunit 1-like [Mercenaria mercenaria]|uniref:gamma-aminobutyric acid type B receptor subunit 1-like n=1 Tax=Mercenaria mercenaria TaxID=6596 RepID=UPI00234F3BD5|nr:gamma-aminobutyric acid type B receptor subunit 1-like [Mercenaria mercenaria]
MKLVKAISTLLVITLCLVEAEQRELRLLGLLPMSGNGSTTGRSCLPAVQMAVNDINVREDILADYHLTYKWTDSKCNFGTPVNRMFEAFCNDPPYVILLGDGCSVGSEATAQVSHLWNLTQFSYSSPSPILSDRNRFPYFFRIGTPDQKMNLARIALMREFDWKKVATIHQALEFFSVAFKVGLYGPKIVWVFAGWYSTNFWRENLDEVDCTKEEMEEAGEGAFFTGPVFKNPIEERGVADLTAKEFEERYYSHPTYNALYKDTDIVAHQCYDHIWIAALALNCSDARLKQIEYPKTLDMFTYQDSDINDIIFDCMSKTNITGVSGRIVLSTEVDPDRILKIERIQGGKRHFVGMYRQDMDPSYFDWIEGAILWKDGIIPRDSTLILEKEKDIPPYLLAVMSSFSGLGIFLSVVYMMKNGVEVRPFVRVCESKYSQYFEWALYITQGALLTFGAFLAWETRKVKIEVLNDTHEIGLCIYNVVILSAVGLIMTLLMEDKDALVYVITSGCIQIGTTFIEIVIFVPKVANGFMM